MQHKHKFTIVLASVALFTGFAAMAEGEDDRGVVHTAPGQVIVNSFGKCVRTQWDAGSDECNPKIVEAAPPAPVHHMEIEKEARTIYFDFNQATLTMQSKRKLDNLASNLSSQNDVKKANIVGYADRIGSVKYNERLSQKRAENVRNYIVSKGYAKIGVAKTRWFGEANPVTRCPNHLSRTALINCLQKDRRVEVEIDYLPEGTKPEQR